MGKCFSYNVFKIVPTRKFLKAQKFRTFIKEEISKRVGKKKKEK